MSQWGGRTQQSLYEQGRTYTGQFSREQFPREHEEPESRGRQLGKDLVSGLVAGLAATLVMTQYQIHSQKLIEKIRSRGRQHPQSRLPQAETAPEEETEPTTVKLASLISRKVAGRELPVGKKALAGNSVHYGFGLLMGGLYGVLRGAWPLSSTAHGVAYGAAVWAGADEIALPAIGVAKWAPEYPIYTHANALAAHLVYAVTLDSCTRAARYLLDHGLLDHGLLDHGLLGHRSAVTRSFELDPRTKNWEETKREFRPTRIHPRVSRTPEAPKQSIPEKRKRNGRTAA